MRLLSVLILFLSVTGTASGQEVAVTDTASGQEAAEFEPIDSTSCVNCHEESKHGTAYNEDLSHSIHEDLDCLNCHIDKDTAPHREDTEFHVGYQSCIVCHAEAGEVYTVHGHLAVLEVEDVPLCDDCHGDHNILPSKVKLSQTHPINLPATCGKCHENLDITRKYEILLDKPIEIYESSVHGKATRGGVYVAATCNDCHSTGGSAHRILAPGHPDSTINHFNIPKTCGRCHQGVENDFWEGIHGKLVKRGETDAPVCTHCHGEHGIIATADPRSPVSRSRVAEATCSPCHESAVLNEKYGLLSGRLPSFIDSYHGLKSKAGDSRVANCASCHGVHRILPSTDSTSTINPANLQTTCGECHPGITAKMAAMPIHGVGGEGLRTSLADLVAKIYIVAIVVIIGLMVLHWLIDLRRQIRLMMARRPQIRRMYTHEVWQHTFLMITFLVLVVSGFALRFSESWLAGFFFGWEGGFELRGVVHRSAAVLFMITVFWHVIYIVFARRGRLLLKDMIPVPRDFVQFGQTILYNLGYRPTRPAFKRFGYVEKAEYWALVWGTIVMTATGILLWFDNWFMELLPKGFLDVALVVHYWEAWLAALAILVWHLYSTVFNPVVYPMNPSWLTGTMPEEMYRHEHADHLEEARRETEEQIQTQIERLSRVRQEGPKEEP